MIFSATLSSTPSASLDFVGRKPKSYVIPAYFSLLLGPPNLTGAAVGLPSFPPSFGTLDVLYK